MAVLYRQTVRISVMAVLYRQTVRISVMAVLYRQTVRISVMAVRGFFSTQVFYSIVQYFLSLCACTWHMTVYC